MSESQKIECVRAGINYKRNANVLVEVMSQINNDDARKLKEAFERINIVEKYELLAKRDVYVEKG